MLAAKLDDESRLIARLREGDERAFEELVRREAPRLLAVTRRILRDEADARDAVQDAFANAFRGFGSFEARASLSTWLHRLAVNAALTRLRTRRRTPEEPIETLLPAFQEDGHHATPPLPWISAEKLVAERETREFVRAAIDRLPQSYAEVLLLRDIEELDTAVVAELLGISKSLVKVRLHRARQALRKLLEPRFGEGAL
jgi:RNA polymerase sigma-70 factor, ECF subfamily